MTSKPQSGRDLSTAQGGSCDHRIDYRMLYSDEFEAVQSDEANAGRICGAVIRCANRQQQCDVASTTPRVRMVTCLWRIHFAIWGAA